MLSELALVCRLARRDLRGGAAGLAVLVGCLALGVAAVAGVGALTASVRAGLAADARTLLGGDIAIRRAYEPLPPEALAWTESRAAAAGDSVEMRAMAAAGETRALAELKAVDAAWPLFGAVELAPPQPMAAALADGGAIADRALLDRLGIAVGDAVSVGGARFEVRAAIVREPDRAASAFALGPRLAIALEALPATGLLRPGALVRHVRKLKLPPDVSARDFAAEFRAAFPGADWRTRTPGQAQSGARRVVERLGRYLTLIGLAALLVGGVGVAEAARAHVTSRLTTLATLKCLGATPATVFRVAALQVMALALAGVAAGAAIGALAPWALEAWLAGRFGIGARAAIYPAPLAFAALYGVLTAALFALLPLARAGQVRAGGLFRHAVAPPEGAPPRRFRAAAAALAAAAGAMAFAAAGDAAAAGWFVGGAAAAAAVLALAGRAAARAARRAARRSGGMLRLALANLGRPGTTAPGAVLALGIGFSALVAIALVESNVRRMVDERLAGGAPAFFLIDIQRDQEAPLAALVEALPETGPLERAPMLRGRLTAIDGAPVGEDDLPEGARWLARSDIGLSFAAAPPPRGDVVAGAWWPADYGGPPLVSFDEETALSAGLGVGSRVAFNVLGRVVEAEIANLRRVSWDAVALNFVAVFAPGAFAGAPYALVGTVAASEAAEGPLIRALAGEFANVSAIPVRALLETARRTVRAAAAAVAAAAAFALAAGVLVLAAAVAAERRARIRDAAILKVLGATRARVLAGQLLEFALLGATAAVAAVAIGGAAAWGFVSGLLEIEWTFPAARAAASALAAAALVAALGLAGTWRAAGRKPATVLRTP